MKLFLTFILLFAVSIFADVDRGLIGNIVYGLLEEIPILGRFALSVYGIILTGIILVLTVLLRKILDVLPVTWHEHGVNLFWQIAAFLFGDEVLTRNARLDPECPHAAAEALRKRVIDKSPILQTKVPWGK